MRVLVVHAHPDPESFSAAVFRLALATLRARGHEVDACDLYAEGFQPVLTRDERRAYHDVGGNLRGIEADVARLRAAEALVICAPTWWYGMPAMLKGWFDRVWAPGVAFDLVPGGGAIVPRLTGLRSLLVLTTYGSPRWFMTLVMREPGRAVLTRGLRRLLAPRARLRYLGHYAMDSSTPATRARFLARCERALLRL